METVGVNLSGKHVFLISDADKFFFLLADSLITKLSVDPNAIVAVVYKSGRRVGDIQRISGVGYYSHEQLALEDYLLAKSLTFMSLRSWNSYIAKEIIDLDPRIIQKLFVFITDDEVARWVMNVQKNGELSPDPDQYISEHCVYVLKKIQYFICPENYFKKVISNVLERSDLKFYDASIVFDILPNESSSQLFDVFKNENNARSVKKRILFGTKSTGWRSLILLLRFLFNRSSSFDFEFFVFVNKYRKILVECYLIYKRALGHSNVNVVYLSHLPPEAYNSLVAICSHVILQGRGGASTARLYVKWARGELLVKKNTPNSYFFKDVYGVAIEEYSDRSELVDILIREPNEQRYRENRNIIVREEVRSLKVLSKVYW
ncbi:hypothetical protein SADO_00775 [Salinisphaera dokdonensis CL-ES53]|uniref:Uncharacterized protein n=1 Tax=Salinisphaera dokdonensis CL-ES53 TaxID=1304272 RepID=A0ABV2AVY0_9GAMM